MVYPKNDEEDLKEFAENYSEENDDELNGLYAHYNIVKNINTLIGCLSTKIIVKCGETQLSNTLKQNLIKILILKLHLIAI